MIEPTTFTRGQQARRPSPMALAMMAALCDATAPEAPTSTVSHPAPGVTAIELSQHDIDALERRRPSLAEVSRPLPRPVDEGRAARDQIVRAADDMASSLEKIAALLEPISQLAERALEEHDGDDDQGEEDH